MRLKNCLKPKNIILFFVLTIVFILSAVSSIASTDNSSSPPRNIIPANLPGEYRLIVKLKPEVAAKAESSLTQTELEIKNTSPKKMSPLFHRHKIKRMAPVYKDVIRWKKRTGKSERDYINQRKQKFPHRARRYHGTSEIPEISRTYIIEPNVNTRKEWEELLDSLRKDPSFEYVELDRIVTVQMTPNDPYFSSRSSWGQSYDDLYGIKKITCPEAWDLANGSGVIVAVIDTGIDKTHPDIAANIWTNAQEIEGNGIDDDNNGYIDDVWGWNFTDSTNSSIDDNGHGTHVAGTIAAVGNNGTGVIGVAPNAKVMDLKALKKDGGGYDSWIAAAIRYAADNGADVINCSFGGPGSSSTLEEAINYAYSLGVVVVAAAGNEQSDVKGYHPGGLHNVITVSALDNNGDLASFSNFGTEVDVAAPGVDILSLRAAGTAMGDPIGEYYTRANGTSMAAPHVSGLAALILSRHPEFSNGQVRQVISSSADDIFTSGFDRNSGFGQVNAFKAVSVDNVLEAQMDGVPSANSLTGYVPITGAVKGLNFSSYTLEYGSGYTPNTWSIINQGSSPVEKGQLGIFDTTVIPDGIYTLRLTVKDNSVPQKIYTDYLEVNVDYVSISDPSSPLAPNLAKVFKPGKIVSINGTAAGPSFQRFRLEWGEGLNPTEWSTTGFTLANTGYSPISNGLLASWDSSVFPGKAGYYQIRLLVENAGFTSEARTTIYLEPDLLSENWPQKLNTRPRYSVLPAKDESGKNSLVLSLPDVLAYSYQPSFCRYSYDGILQYSTSFNYGFLGQLAVGNLDGKPGEEVVFTRDSNYIRIVKPDNTFIEFSPDNTNRYNFQQTPMVLQDLDGDSTLEILAIGNEHQNNDTKYLFAWNTKGALVSNNFPLLVLDNEDVGFKPKTRFLAIDLDNDGKKEIIVVNGESVGSSSLKLYSWDGLPRNWPVQPFFPNSLIMDIAAGDLDGDGQVEIVLSTFETIPLQNGRVSCGDTKIYLLAANGAIKEGWPFTIPYSTTIGPSVDIGIADMDRDGNSEIVFSGINYVNVLKIDGTSLSSAWPYRDSYLRNFSIGDINGDTFPEIVIVRYKPVTNHFTDYDILAVNKDGMKIRSWKMLGLDEEGPDLSNTEPLLGDFDNNGKVDIGVSYGLSIGKMIVQGVLTVLTLNADYNPDYMDWPMIFHDPQNTSVQSGSLRTLTGIGLDASSYSIKAGLTKNVTVTGSYTDGNTKNITHSATYQIDDSQIATVDAAGKISALAPGVTTLTVSFCGKTSKAQVIVEPMVVTSIRLDSPDYKIAKGLTKNISVIATFSDNSTENVTSLATYQISDTTIATVDAFGAMKGLAIGATTLTASFGGKDTSAPVTVEPPILIAINLDMSSYRIKAGLTQSVITTAVYSDGSSQPVTDSVTYEIADTHIATVDLSGKIQGLVPGSTVLTVGYGGQTANAQVIIEEPTVTKITIDPKSFSIPLGSTKKVTVTATYSDNNTKDVTNSTWYSIQDSTVAQIDDTGTITGLKIGRTSLSISYGGVSTGGFDIFVTEPVLDTIRLDMDTYRMAVNDVKYATVTAIYTDGSIKDVTNAVFQISDTNIATVDATGKIMGLTPGTTTLTVTYQNKTVTAQVIVDQLAVTAISLNATMYVIPAGLTRNVTVTATYSDSSTQDVTSSATFQIANTGIATVDATGKINGLTPGTTTLTVNYQGITTSAQVNVGQPEVMAIGLNMSSYSMPAGLTKNVTVAATYSDNSTKDVTYSVTYQIGNTGIATVDATGRITGLLPGTTTLTVSYQGKTATAEVNVEQPIVTSISLDADNYVIPAGLTRNIAVTANYSDSSAKDVTTSATYQIANTNIATVDSAGKITALVSGTTSLTVSYQGKTTTAAVNVEAPVLTGIKLDANNYNITVNSTKNIVVKATYSDNSTGDITNSATYHITDASIATVSSTGMIKGLAFGTAVLTVSYEGKTTTAQVTVGEAVITKLSCNADQYNNYWVTAGLTQKIMVTATYSDNSTKDVTNTVSYGIGNGTIAKVDDTGTITGLNVGRTTLSFWLSGYGAVGGYYINVTEPVITAVNIDTDTYSLQVNTVKNVSVTATYSDNSTKDVTNSATYEIANTNIASVDSTGKITGLAPGTSTLTVSYNGKTVVAEVIVKDPAGRDIYEPNDSIATAYEISRNTNITPTIHSSSDSDYFKFTISSPVDCIITLTPPSDKDYDLYLLDSSGSQIGISFKGTGIVDKITKSLTAGTYYIKVLSYNGAYSTAPYTLEVATD